MRASGRVLHVACVAASTGGIVGRTPHSRKSASLTAVPHPG
jgi:hypothetical protein